jgi:hypothetical protein
VQRLELAGVRRSAKAGLAVAVVVPIAIVVLLVFGLGGSKSPTQAAAVATHAITTAAKPRPPSAGSLTAQTIAHNSLAKAVAGINVSVTAKGMLPPGACKLTNSTQVTCTQPTPAVDVVIFRTYPSLKALYSAYEARVSQIAQGPFRANFGNCTETMTSGEIGWNHDFKHPSMYPISDFTSGQITDDKAAGRVYCTFENSNLYLVWTQDDGRVLGELSGAPHVDAYVWWRQVHHSIVMPGSPSMMSAMESPMSAPSKTSTTSMPSTKSAVSVPSKKRTKSTPSTKSTKGMPATTSTSSMN